MKIKHLSFHFGFGLALSSSLLFLGIAPQAKAQFNSSDTTGAIITTTDLAGFGRGRRRITVFRTDRIRLAINQAAVSLLALLRSGNLVVVSRGVSTAISARVQQALLIVLTGSGGDVRASVNQLAIALVNPRRADADVKSQSDNLSESNRTKLAQNLASSLTGLTANDTVDPAKLRSAVAAYNRFIRASSAEYLSNPPEELTAIQAVLSSLLNAANAAA